MFGKSIGPFNGQNTIMFFLPRSLELPPYLQCSFSLPFNFRTGRTSSLWTRDGGVIRRHTIQQTHWEHLSEHQTTNLDLLGPHRKLARLLNLMARSGIPGHAIFYDARVLERFCSFGETWFKDYLGSAIPIYLRFKGKRYGKIYVVR